MISKQSNKKIHLVFLSVFVLVISCDQKTETRDKLVEAENRIDSLTQMLIKTNKSLEAQKKIANSYLEDLEKLKSECN